MERSRAHDPTIAGAYPVERLTATTLARMPCDYCGKEFDPISTRWLCPHCHMKANCCDGAPLGE